MTTASQLPQQAPTLSQAMHEAARLFHALMKGNQTYEDIVGLIGNASPERLKMRAAFDHLCLQRGIDIAKKTKFGPGRRFSKVEVDGIKVAIRLGKRPGEIRKLFHMTLAPLLRIRRTMGVYRDCRRRPQPSEAVRAEVLGLLPTHSVRAIQDMLKLSQRRVLSIAATVGGSAALKVSGSSGRRVRGELRQRILESIKANMRNVDIRSTYGVSLDTIQKLKRELGQTSDSRKIRKLTDEQAAEIRVALATHALTWKQLAQKYHVGLSTIGSVYRGEKGYPAKEHNEHQSRETSLPQSHSRAGRSDPHVRGDWPVTNRDSQARWANFSYHFQNRV